jgi:DNA invertase Pin-like site-specific DNA recombinase
VLSILATIAKQERIRISERVHAGLAKAKKEGRVGGRPRLVTSHNRILQLDEEGLTQREIAEQVGISVGSVCSILRAHRTPGPAAEAEQVMF